MSLPWGSRYVLRSEDVGNIRLKHDVLCSVVVSGKDKLGLVMYDTHVTSTGELKKMDSVGKAEMTRVIEELSPGSRTNLSGGLVEGLIMIEKLRETATAGDAETGAKKTVSSVLLMTDGMANEGVCDSDGIIKCLTEKGRKEFHVYPADKELSDEIAANVYTFGFGSDHKAELLQKLSDAGNGVYYYLDSSEKIPESFADCLGGLLSTAAQNIKLDVTAENGCQITQAYGGRSTKSQGSGVHIEMPVGDIQSEECRDLVFCLELPATIEEASEWTVLTAKLSCFNVITSLMENKEVSLKIKRSRSVPSDRQRNHDVDTHMNRITTAQVMESASDLANAGQLERARALIVEVSVTLFILIEFFQMK